MLRQWRSWLGDTGYNLFTHSTTNYKRILRSFPRPISVCFWAHEGRITWEKERKISHTEIQTRNAAFSRDVHNSSSSSKRCSFWHIRKQKPLFSLLSLHSTQHYVSKHISYSSLKRNYILLSLKRTSKWIRDRSIVLVHLNISLRNDVIQFEFYIEVLLRVPQQIYFGSKSFNTILILQKNTNLNFINSLKGSSWYRRRKYIT